MELPNNRVEALSSVFTALNRYMLHCMVIGKWFLISWIQTCHRKTMVQFEKICKMKPLSWKTALFSCVMPLNFHFFSFQVKDKKNEHPWEGVDKKVPKKSNKALTCHIPSMAESANRYCFLVSVSRQHGVGGWRRSIKENALNWLLIDSRSSFISWNKFKSHCNRQL